MSWTDHAAKAMKLKSKIEQLIVEYAQKPQPRTLYDIGQLGCELAQLRAKIAREYIEQNQ